MNPRELREKLFRINEDCVDTWSDGWQAQRHQRMTFGDRRSFTSLEGVQFPYVVVALDRIGCLNEAKRRDYLLFAGERSEKINLAMAVEMTSGKTKRARVAYEQLQEGARLIERTLIENGRVKFVPVLAGRSADDQRLPKRRFKFFGRNEIVKIPRSGDRILNARDR